MQTLKDFCTTNGVRSLGAVRLNQNNYPYSTFIMADGTAENIYFSQEASKQVKEKDSAKVFKDMWIRLVEYNDGSGREPRLKIVSASDYVNVDDLWL